MSNVDIYTAPVNMDIKWAVKRFEDKWSYTIKMNFNFDHYPSDCITDELLVGLGVYKFNHENEAKIQAKRTAKEMQNYFSEELKDIIVKGMEIDEYNSTRN